MNPQKGKDLLRHYFRLCAEKGKWRYDSDSDEEINDIVDNILSEPRSEVKRLEMHIVQLESRISLIEKMIKNNARSIA